MPVCFILLSLCFFSKKDHGWILHQKVEIMWLILRDVQAPLVMIHLCLIQNTKTVSMFLDDLSHVCTLDQRNVVFVVTCRTHSQSGKHLEISKLHE